jgi:hypothetical protein
VGGCYVFITVIAVPMMNMISLFTMQLKAGSVPFGKVVLMMIFRKQTQVKKPGRRCFATLRQMGLAIYHPNFIDYLKGISILAVQPKKLLRKLHQFGIQQSYLMETSLCLANVASHWRWLF